MPFLTLLLLVVALALFELAMLKVPSHPRCDWLAAGLAVWMLTQIIAALLTVKGSI